MGLKWTKQNTCIQLLVCLDRSSSICSFEDYWLRLCFTACYLYIFANSYSSYTAHKTSGDAHEGEQEFLHDDNEIQMSRLEVSADAHLK